MIVKGRLGHIQVVRPGRVLLIENDEMFTARFGVHSVDSISNVQEIVPVRLVNSTQHPVLIRRSIPICLASVLPGVVEISSFGKTTEVKIKETGCAYTFEPPKCN